MACVSGFRSGVQLSLCGIGDGDVLELLSSQLHYHNTSLSLKKMLGLMSTDLQNSSLCMYNLCYAICAYINNESTIITELHMSDSGKGVITLPSKAVELRR